jgi:hypothetical protein
MQILGKHYIKGNLRKDRQCVSHNVHNTHATVKYLTRRLERCEHKLYFNSFMSPDLFDDFTDTKIDS